jgi:hypothetical protein
MITPRDSLQEWLGFVPCNDLCIPISPTVTYGPPFGINYVRVVNHYDSRRVPIENGGTVDLISQRFLDVLMAIPCPVLAIATVLVLGPGLNTVLMRYRSACWLGRLKSLAEARYR